MTVPNYQAFDQMLRAYNTQGYGPLECTQHGFNGIKAALSTLRKRNISLFSIQLRCEPLQPEEQYTAPTGGLVCFRVWLEKKKTSESARGNTAKQMREIGLGVDKQERPAERELVDEAERIQREYKRYKDWCDEHPGATDGDKIAAGWAAQAREDREFEETLKGLGQQGEGQTDEEAKGSQGFFEKQFGF